ncbi:major facilitator superfamily domain-containing protein [Exophiala viscosa]|uniref:major facilitator superfamily domain-containing protein n=1 Tax=Exophiala viscosa TaxID=2486360 RepID=UPI00219E1E73|nr:major facilitator superfamily domain-containing protein [Exophiala viscosa]
MSHRNQNSASDERSPLIKSVNIQDNGPQQRARLLSDNDSADDESPDREDSLAESVLEDKSWFYMILLTICIGGLQIVWSVELSNGSPYLLSLGMSKALLAAVWLAGPLTGALVQPYIGIRSDRCRVSWGRRKPFMVAGTLGVIVTSMILAYARDIVRVIGRKDVDAPYGGGYRIGTIVLATVMMWCLDFSINTVQAAIRAFIVDNAPSHQQESANAWASRMTGVGNVLGYVFGYLNLPKYFHFLGNSQFKVLVVIASFFLTITVLTSLLTIKERNPQLDPPSNTDFENGGFVAFFKQVFNSIKHLPPQTRKVCEIQFFHWIGWFPFLFYITTYIGQLYVDPRLHPGIPDSEVDQLWAQATRVGTFALLIYAITAFASNIVLPFLVQPTYQNEPDEDESDDEDDAPRWHQPITPTTPVGTRTPYRENASSENGPRRPGHRRAYSQPITPISPVGATRYQEYFSYVPESSRPLASRSQSNISVKSFGRPDGVAAANDPTLQENPTGVKAWLTNFTISIPGLTLRRAWLLSQILFALCTFSTFFIKTPTAATIMTALVGVSWSLTLWAPFALISAEISKRDEIRRKKQRQRRRDGEDDDKEDEEDDQAGIILGLHNVAISAPQIIATLISSAVFKGLQKPRNVPGDTSVGWTLRIGGVATLISAFITWRMKEPSEEEEPDP